MSPTFEVSAEDSALIDKIVEREARRASLWGGEINRLQAAMDITACHANGCPLKLRELLDASAEDFTHDMLGIAKHIDRTTGKLEDIFMPRFAANQ